MNNLIIKNTKEFTGLNKIIDFTRLTEHRDEFQIKDYIKAHVLYFFITTLANLERKTISLNNELFFPLFHIFYKKHLKKKIKENDLKILQTWNSNIFYFSQRFKWWLINEQFKEIDKDEAINAMVFYFDPTYYFFFLRRFYYLNYKEARIDRIKLLQKNIRFRYNDPYYLFFKLKKLRKWKKKLMIDNLRQKNKINIIKNLFCLEGIIGLEKATASSLIKNNKTTLLKKAYSLHKKYRIPFKYKKFKRLTFKLTRMNQFRFNIVRRPEYSFWYNKLLFQISNSQEYILNPLINEQ